MSKNKDVCIWEYDELIDKCIVPCIKKTTGIIPPPKWIACPWCGKKLKLKTKT